MTTSIESQPAVGHRRFEARRPGQIYRLDISAVKERRSTLVPLWKFTMQDDQSRFLFLRFVACPKPNSWHVVDFELEAFRAMGVPQALYADNVAVIASILNQRAASILENAFFQSGGFSLELHKPSFNANVTGQVEEAHQKFEKLISIGEVATVEDLNVFAARFCDSYNHTEHRTTGVKPELRFRAGDGVMRLVPNALFSKLIEKTRDEFSIEEEITMDQHLDLREVELREINRLALELQYIIGDDRTIYETLLSTYFTGVTSALDLTPEQRREWTNMLRAWKRGRDLMMQQAPPTAAVEAHA